MKKAIMFIASFAILAVTLMAFTDRGEAPGIGYRAPGITLTNDSTVSPVSLHQYKGEYVLLTFWSSSDASSRIRCNEYSSVKASGAPIEHIAVNFDNSKGLWGEVVKNDNLTASEQYHVEGHEALLIKENYHLEKGLHSFLIDKKGKIIAVDPSAEQLETLSA